MIPIHHKETSKGRHLSSGCDLIQTVSITSMSALERNALEDQEGHKDQEGHVSPIPTILVLGKTPSAGPYVSLLF